MEIRKLDWDSYFFDFPIGYIFIDKEPPSNFSKILNSDIYTLIQIKSKQLINIISETHSLSYSEVKIIFSKNLSEISHKIILNAIFLFASVDFESNSVILSIKILLYSKSFERVFK